MSTLEPFNGSIELITGPMFSGKSSELIILIERYLIAKRSVIALKWGGDTRYTGEPYITTHSGLQCKCIPCDNEELKMIYPKIKDFEIICIDEGSFFRDIVEFCDMLANKGHRVVIASLVGDADRKGFNDILNLIPRCEKVTFLKAICMECYKDGASFTEFIRTDVDRNGKEYVGGAESYRAVCRKCFYKNKTKQ